MISISLLNIKDDNDKIIKIDNLKTDYLHIDIMDGLFVNNKVDFLELPNVTTKRDIHLMVYNVKDYVDYYKKYQPEYITFHLEAIDNIEEMINYIKALNIKVGISIKPNTPVEDLKPYLDKVDLVLVMSVEPGLGGQKFMENSQAKIEELDTIRKEHNYQYVIEVDGGINNITKAMCKSADILVVGSYITMSDNYEERLASML